MKLSEITASDVVEYLRLDVEDYNPKLLDAVMKAANKFILDYTGLTAEEADEKESLWIAYMVLVQDMHDNRSMYVEKKELNRTVELVLNMYCRNLVM